MIVVATSNPFDGMKLYGPFEDEESAHSWEGAYEIWNGSALPAECRLIFFAKPARPNADG
jgi:hypothetical protein